MLLSYLKLSIAALIPVFATALLYRLDRSQGFGALSYAKKQVVYGLIFGAIAILGTEWGIPLEGAVLNCRDAAPLCAGLFFGGPAGVIAGGIGALERWFSVYWGVGTYTRLACTLSTFLAGVIAAGLRKHIFEMRRPRLLLAAASAFLVESLHQSMVFFFHINDAVNAFAIVNVTAVPMLAANTLSVVLAGAVYAQKDGSLKQNKTQRISLFTQIERQLLILVALSFLFTTAYSYRLHTTVARRQTESTLLEAAQDIAEGRSYVSMTGRSGLGPGSVMLLYDGEGNLIYSSRQGEPGDTAAMPQKTDDAFSCTLFEEKYFALRHGADGYQILVAMPEAEIYSSRDISGMANGFVQMLIYGLLFAGITLLVRKTVVRSLEGVNGSLARITSGDLETKVEQRGSQEFSQLSDDINATVDTLKEYIAEAEARNEKELAVAREIQLSALPRTFPAFPKRADLDIYAFTQPARQVGGDFYDFYFANDGRFYILAADVSGKGIPAAMFMMRAKTQLKGIIETGGSIEEAFFRGNNALCEGNDAEMFVTAWMAEIDMQTGDYSFVNAGHNPPLITGADGTFGYLREKHGFVLGSFNDLAYRKNTRRLSRGGRIVLYTDGVTEATNVRQELFGEERLLELVNANRQLSAHDLGEKIRSEVIAFTGEAEQFDDITVLVFDYPGAPAEICFEQACVENIPAATEFLEKELRALGCPEKIISRMDIALDETFSNIAFYGYPQGSGPVTLRLTVQQAPRAFTLTLIDAGVPYDPLSRAEPTLTGTAEERTPGGLGIYLTRKLLDEVTYERTDEKNVLHLTKRF